MIPVLAGHTADFHLFEANRRLCQILRKSAAMHPRVKIAVVEGCVSDQPGESKFRIESDPGESFIWQDGQEIVPNLVLDDYVRRQDIQSIAFLKCDVEGSEYRAFLGMGDALSRGVVKAIYFEMITVHLKRAGSGNRQLLDFLSQCGFALFHCKDEDFGSDTRNSFVVNPERARMLTINGFELHVAPLDMSRDWDNETFATDLLGIHPLAGFL